MKKLLLVTTLFITALSLNAQTFTYTGTGNYTDQANWAPSYPGDDGIENPNYTLNIDGNCTLNSTNLIFAEINISGVLNIGNFHEINLTSLNLNGGTFAMTQTINAGAQADILGAPGQSQLSGTGTFLIDTILAAYSIFNFTINPGDTNTHGTITFDSVFGSNLFTSQFPGSQFVFDIFSATNYDSIINARSANSVPGTNPITINIPNTATVNHNDTFTLFVNTNTTLYNNLAFNTNPSNGFQPQFNYVSNNIVATLLDVEGPVITNCPSDQNVTADCGTFYTIPDYTTTTTATDNDSATTITYTQSPQAGLGAVDGTVITITATDAAGNSSDCTFTLNVTEAAVLRVLDFDDVGKHIALYPNPSNGLFTIKNTSGLLLETGQVIDAKGAVIKTVNLSSYSEEKTINLGDLSTGLYLFKIITPDGFVTKKMLIK